MSNPKQHHFVPRWYLNGFTDPESGFLHVYDRDAQNFRRQKPEKVMTRNQYYKQSWAKQGVDPYIAERRAAEIEAIAKPAFERLLSMPHDFTPEETAALVVYMEFQRIRVPRQASMAKRIIEAWVMTKADEVFRAEFMKGKIVISESARFQYMREVMGEMALYLERMRWEIHRAAPGRSFITTDSPVSLFNVAFPPPSESGIGLVGTRVLFPLNSELLLITRHPEYVRLPHVSPLARLPRPSPGDVQIAVDYYPDPLEENAVDLYNHILFRLSDRTIAGRDRESLEKAIAYNPEEEESL